jgi:hypothetical protein
MKYECGYVKCKVYMKQHIKLLTVTTKLSEIGTMWGIGVTLSTFLKISRMLKL